MASNTIEYVIKIGGNAYSGIARLGASVKQLNKNTEQTSSLLEKVGKVTQSFNNIFYFGSKVSNAIGKIINSGAKDELQKLDLTTLFKGNVQAAGEMFKKISDYGKETVYDKSGLIDAQKTMMSFGIEGEKAFTVLKQIGDVAMGDADRMRSLALAFSQTSSTGHLMGQDLLQMINAGFNPLQVISERTGKSVATLKDEMSKGAISADMVAQAFAWATDEAGLFYKGAEVAGNSTAGLINQLKDTANESLISVFQVLQPVINTCLTFATGFLESLPAIFSSISASVQNVIGFFSDFAPVVIGVATAIGILTVACNTNRISLMAQELWLNILIVKEGAVAAATNVWAAAQKLLNVVMAMNPIGLVLAVITALAGAIAFCWKKFAGFRAVVKTVWDTMKGFGKVLKDFVINRIRDVIIGLGAMGSAIAKLFKGDFKGAVSSAKTGLIKISGVDALKKAVDQSKAVVGEAKGNYSKHLSAENAKQIAKENAKEQKKVKSADGNLERQRSSSEVIAKLNGNKLGNMQSTSSAERAIASGGQKILNISVGKFFDNINFNTTTLKESAYDIENTVLECLARVLMNGATTAQQ